MDGSRARVRVWARWSAVALTAGAASALGAGAASADESYGDNARLGPQFALIRIGQVEDPLEHVLDHVTVSADIHFHP
ncbi:hypothetical protein [Streptomyces sp. 6N223]|uniref:hypothetical protein n=1 Tax=Streptomyces sp. 6N223 TaxID=3457412 RepID=UPI003FD2AECF